MWACGMQVVAALHKASGQRTVRVVLLEADHEHAGRDVGRLRWRGKEENQLGGLSRMHGAVCFMGDAHLVQK